VERQCLLRFRAQLLERVLRLVVELAGFVASALQVGDVAKLVESGCRNVGALMCAHISAEQIERLMWIRSQIGFPRIVLFLDRDEAGQKGVFRAFELLRQHDFEVSVFDWDRNLIPDTVKDPADMPAEQLQLLPVQGCF
jgi:acetolactate synthase regulatory subunit